MTGACDECLRRGYLVGRLAARIAAMLDRPAKRVGGLLSLPEDELIEAVSDRSLGAPADLMPGFDPGSARAEMAGRRVRALCRHDNRYPPQLVQLLDAPAVLFVCGHGDLSLLSHDSSVALVGTRRPSPYGREVAHDLGRGLGAAGVPVISGLALGIDAEAHRGCLAAGGTAVAVLACGPDVPYPRTNRRLYDQVCERGLVVSELPPGQRPYRWSFPARNRIMAGLARMTVVVEAAEPSGSLITTQFATQLGRAVGAVPGQVTSRVAAGTNNLLKDGAALVTGPRDLLDELFGSESEEGERERERAIGGSIEDPVALRLLEAVEASLGIDGISAHAGVPAQEARAGLSRLERSGHVRRDPLGGYRRTAAPC
jgi:DNA processing protein